MSDEKATITKEELSKIQEQQANYQKFLLELGATSHAISNLENQLESLKQSKNDILKDILFLEEKAAEVQKELTDKYGGNINVDINTGEFTYISK